LKHRTVEKTVEKCELAIAEGGEPEENEGNDLERDSLESKLIVRLHCKHGIYTSHFFCLVFPGYGRHSPVRLSAGVVKTHRLLLHTTELCSPAMLDSEDESRLVIAPKALRDVIEHFPFPRGPKADPKLIWKFDEEDVFLRGQEASFDSEGDYALTLLLFCTHCFFFLSKKKNPAKGLSTELSLSTSEFEQYDVLEPPITICFHIKEFQVRPL
jgi:cell cycle checkpoint control protein RAD9A